MKLAGKVVLVAGASSGIGAATALELARRGAKVALLGRRAERLEAVASKIQSLGGPEALVIVADLTDPEAVASAMEQVQSKCGGLDVLLYNAGVGQWAALAETRREQVQAILDVNLVSAIGCIQAAIPVLSARGGGRIVLVSSIAGLRGMPGGSIYSASKAALEGLADSLRVELASRRIGVTTVYPSLTRTEFFDHLAAGSAPSLEGKWAEDPETVAPKIVRAIERERRRAILSLKGRLIVTLARWAPRLLDAMQRRKWKQ